MAESYPQFDGESKFDRPALLIVGGVKTCALCRLSLPDTAFNRSSRSRDGKQAYCRECQKAHYQANSMRHRANVRRTSAARRASLRVVAFEAMAAGCVDCGCRDIRVLDFDHVRGEKVADVGSMVRRGRSVAAVQAEIAKCEVRCKNCHAIATVTRLGGSWHDRFLPKN